MPANTVYDYDLNPAPQSGTGAFGKVPGALGLPNPAGDLAAQIPGLPQANQAASAGLIARLSGQLSPGTQAMIQNAAAEWGVRSGMPGSGLAQNKSLRDLGLMSEAVQHQALQDYASFVPTVSSTQTVSPALKTEIALQNAINRAAPNPQQAQTYASSLFNSYLNNLRGGGQVSGLPPSAPGSTSWASDRGNPGEYRAGGVGPSAPGFRQEIVPNTGSGTVFGVGGAASPAGGGMSEYDWIANQGFDPASFGIYPTSSGSMYMADPRTPYTSGVDYNTPAGPTQTDFQAQYPNLASAPEEDLTDLGL